jgi:hypothetical protein
MHFELEFPSLEIGHDPEGIDSSVASGQTLGELEQAIDGLHGPVGNPRPHEGYHAPPMPLDRATQADEGNKSPLAGPPAPLGKLPLVFLGEDLLEEIP